ncbi:MAG TPA: MOSC and FAD-binding oxidoreductase domain-containing protein [Bryobacteraceae bacterium]|nr:MOSC and FAD-binding oxidoreductase domain-containing protein [Bryobacteraceae bacterium]
MPKLLAVNIGLPQNIQWRGETVHTGIWKHPVQGRCAARRLNLEGDGQGDLAGHGGEQRAVMVYQIDSYRYWERTLGRRDFTFGQFGENFTVEGLPDDEVCIGDRYRLGSALFEVTQPRVTCYRVGIRMDEPRMAALLVAHHRPGFYLRVLEEGEVGAGDEFVKVAEGPERFTVADIDALLYLPGHRPDQLQRALRIPALSPGWKGSFEALAAQDGGNAPASGNRGLSPAAGKPPAWRGFRPLRVARVERESAGVTSLTLESEDGSALPPALPGQFLVLRLQPAANLPVILRNYSMSGAPGAGTYRVSVKQEANGKGSTFLSTQVKRGDVLEVSAPRGTFTLQPGEEPVVLLSAGIGATPVLAMLHSLAANRSAREVWWLYGARNAAEHPFAREVLDLAASLPHFRRFVAYSRPAPEDRLGEDYDAPGRLSLTVLQQLGVPSQADFYLCGPPAFLRSFAQDLTNWGVASGRLHQEVFGPEQSVTPGISKAPARPPHPPAGVPGPGPMVSFARSGLDVPWSPAYHSLLEFAETCDVPVKWSCRTGVCHTCECALIGGSVRYDPEPLDPPSDGNVLICCSRPESPVELDL